VPLLVLLFLWLAQQQTQQTPEPNTQGKQVNDLIGQIRRLVGSEPVVFGIDTRLRTAAVLPPRYSQVARDLLRDAQAARSGVADPGERDMLGVRLARAWAPIDVDEAERVIASLPRGAAHDYVAEGYDQLYLFLTPRPAAARSLVSKGLRSGALRLVSVSKLIEDSSQKDHDAASALFSELLAAFPRPYFPEDILYLLDQAKPIAKFNRRLAVEAIDRALSAAASQAVHDQPKRVQEKLFRQITALLSSIDPEVLQRYKEDWPELGLPPLSEPEPKPQEEKNGTNLPDISGLSYFEALAQVRQTQSPTDRIEKFIELSRREDLTPEQRDSVASEALSATIELPLSDDRLTGLAMLSRDFARRNELAKAGLASHMLSETFSKACQCGGAKCHLAGQDFDCLQNVQDFAEYLDEFKVSPESMGLHNISLEARLLILKLAALLTKN
jgi:hypothetical protein